MGQKTKYIEIVDEAYECIQPQGYRYRIGQNKSELLDCAKFVEKLGVRNLLEIGTQFGGSFFVWCRLATGKKISIDLARGPFGGIDEASIIERNNLFESKFRDVHFLNLNSHDESTVEEVKKILGGGMLDFLFIDSDHSYEGVKKDYELYRGLVKKGGYIAFHDINEIADCQVDKLWKELKGEKLEINHHESWFELRSNLGGIGLLRKG